MKTYLNTTSLFLLISFFITACNLSKEVVTEKTAIPEKFRGDNHTDTSGIALLSIQDFFQESAVKALIDTALYRNNDLLVALKNIESAQLLFKQSKLGNLPDLSLQVNANSSRPSDNSLNGLSASQFLQTKHIEDFNAGILLNWEADIWGKIKNTKQAALAAYLQSTEAKKAIQTRLVADVAKGFYTLLMMDAQLDAAKKNLALRDSTLHIIKLQFDAGQVTSLAIQQAEAQNLESAGLIAQLEQSIIIQENALSVLTGKVPGPVVRLQTLQDTEAPTKLSAGLPSAMVSRRPDVKFAELSLAIASAKVGIANANLYPSLNITAAGGLNSFKASNWFNMPASLFGTVAGGITQPLFQRKLLKTQYEIAKVEREKGVIAFRQSVLVAVGEVSNELVKINKLEEQYAISLSRVAALRNAVNNANFLFRNGMATYLEVIVAQSNSLQSELELAAVKTAQLSAAVELYRSLGGGV
jgi:multidrug efflux system outer membrane protein